MRLFRREHHARPGHPEDAVPDERIFGRHYTGPRPWVIGLFVVILLAALSYLAFVKEIPFTGKGYELHATFENAATLRSTAPVRIAGVNVGEVTSVERAGDAAEVTFTVSDEGRPIHADAEIEIRPRLFLEGNFFLDLRPGSPSAPELDEGGQIPVTQTATAVQLDEVLTSLQSDSRRNLQRLLDGYGTALTYEPTAADDADQDPSVQGETAAQSLNDALRHGGPAGRDSAIVVEALLGRKPHDLSGLIAAQRDVFSKLEDRESELQGLITNFNVTTGALAAESENLSATVRELAPTLEEARPSLQHLSDALPPFRRLAIELEPGVAELPDTIDAFDPWLAQMNPLLGDRELGGTAKLLKGAAPGLARTAKFSRPLFRDLGLLSRCVSENLIPAGDVVINDTFSTGQPNYREFFYAAANVAGESQSFDGNGQYVRVQSGGGPTLVRTPTILGGFQNEFVYGNTIELPTGVQPLQPRSLPPFRMDVACHSNAVPDINGPAGAVAPPDLVAP
jgi:phospholipid/cholesterol/gamma-HCH transport system substrate-binding protein